MTPDRRRHLGVFALVVAGAWSSPVPAFGQAPVTISLGAEVTGAAPHDYLLPQPQSGQPVACRIVAPIAGSSLRLQTWSRDGTNEVVSTDQPGAFQLLVLPAQAERVRVANEGGGAYPAYALTCSAETPARVESLVASGVAIRGRVSSPDYLGLYDFAQEDWSQPKDYKATVPAARIRGTLASIAGLSEFSNGEPVVLFIGIAGLAKILVVDPDTGAANPDRDNLNPTKRIWVAYVEDDLTPYETSIDIQFNRSSPVKFDQFEPGASQLGAAAAMRLIGSQPRSVKLGLKRVSLELPMSLQIAFTRQGGLYGFRQWQKSLRVRRGWGDVSGSLFVAATENNLNTHQLEPTDVAPLGSPDFDLIVQDWRRRQVYAALRVGWPGARAAGEDSVTRMGAFKGGAIPDLVLGIGLPPTGATAAYAGLAWPIPRLRWLHFSAGAAILWQSRLKEQSSPYPGEDGMLAVGSKVPLNWTEADIVDGTKPVARLTFGLVVDLFTWP